MKSLREDWMNWNNILVWMTWLYPDLEQPTAAMPGLQLGTKREKMLHHVNCTHLNNKSFSFSTAKDIPRDNKNIAACYTFPQKQNTRKKIVRLANRKHIIELLKLTKKLKGTGVFVNEHLTKRNSEIACQARTLKKEKWIQDTWTRNSKVMIKLNGTPEQAKY